MDAGIVPVGLVVLLDSSAAHWVIVEGFGGAQAGEKIGLLGLRAKNGRHKVVEPIAIREVVGWAPELELEATRGGAGGK